MIIKIYSDLITKYNYTDLKIMNFINIYLNATKIQKVWRGYFERKPVFDIVKNFSDLIDIDKLRNLVDKEFTNTIRGKIAKEENSNLKIDSDISEYFIKECIEEGKRVGKGSGPIDVVNEELFIDVACLCMDGNKTNEKSIMQNFEKSGNDLDKYFKHKNDKSAVELYLNDLNEKWGKIPKNIYYIIFISTKKNVYLSVLKINKDKLLYVKSKGFTKQGKSIQTKGFINSNYGAVILYKSKKRFELRLTNKILKYSNKLFTLT